MNIVNNKILASIMSALIYQTIREMRIAQNPEIDRIDDSMRESDTYLYK